MNKHEKALDSIFGDMDDMETKKMFPEESKGMSVTITLTPSESHEEEEKEEGISGDKGFEDLPADHDISMCKGGCAYHKGGIAYNKGGMAMAEGGQVPQAKENSLSMGETDEMSLPPFLRKKKKV